VSVPDGVPSRVSCRLFALALLLPLTGVSAQSAGGHADTVAARLVVQLVRGEYGAAEATFTPSMAQAVPEAKLRETWEKLREQVGEFRRRTGTRVQKVRALEAVIITAEFERGTLDLRVVVDSADRIAGFFIQAAVPTGAAALPPYAPQPGTYTERDIVVGAPGWPLAGTLMVPRSSAPVPGVVLIQGSGPQDRDETIGPNKPFRDLALGLVAQGIAVLRYDKRTFASGRAMLLSGRPITVEEETVADALVALDSLRRVAEVDSAHVYLLGHSLGGYLAPRIAARDRAVAGVIILAGNTRPLEDLIVEQLDYLAASAPASDRTAAAQRESMLEQVAKIKALTPADSASPTFLFGAPAAYWLDLRGYDPVRVAGGSQVPLLILRGERDYQVTSKDYAGWLTLAGRPQTSFKTYPGLNHLFLAGEGASRPEEYQRPGHVAEEVIRDIAAWVRAPGAPRP
jgi:uncharacterized protein